MQALQKLNILVKNKTVQQHIENNSVKIPESGCWLWVASLTNRGGYGQVGHATYGTEKAHRLSFVCFEGHIPDAKTFVCHTCDIPSCVNPKHLFLGSAKINFQDMISKGRGNYLRTAKASRKLSDDQVRDIRASTKSQEELGKVHNISSGAVGMCRRRQQYKDVI